MERKTEGIKFAIVIGVAILIGVLVLIFYKDYRIEKNLESNRNYYPEYETYHKTN